MWVFYESNKKQLKQNNVNILLIILLVISSVWWFLFSMYQKYTNFKAIEEKQNQALSKIEEEYTNQKKEEEKIDKFLENSKKEHDNDLNININVKEWETSDDILNNLFSEVQTTKTISSDLSIIMSESEKKQKQNDSIKENLLFKWSFCILWSWDQDKKWFFNSFSYDNWYLVRNYTKKMDMWTIEYTMYCFQNALIYKNPYLDFRKKQIQKTNTYEENFKELLWYLKKRSQWYSKIELIREQWELKSYKWCLMKGNWLDFLKYIKIWTQNIHKKEDLIQNWVIQSDCVIDNIQNFFIFEKQIKFREYYEWLFKTKKLFNENKWTQKYKQWYENSTYEEWIEKFLKYLNTEKFKLVNEYTQKNDTNEELLINDQKYYYNEKNKNLFQKYLEELSSWLLNKNWFEIYLN